MGRRTGALLLATVLLSTPDSAQSQPRADVATDAIVPATAPLDVADADLVIVALDVIVLPPAGQELPEPAMLVMMLLGLCVVGYRSRRDENETFR